MGLSEVSVRRPVTVMMATLAVGVFGYISVQQLPIELLPDLSYPSLTVQTVYRDAAPISVERFVTRPIEETVGVIPGVREMRSTSRAGLSEITLEFEWGEPIEFLAMDVREKLGLVQLPRETELPRVLRFDPSLDPVVRVALSGDRPLGELWQLADRWVKPRFEAVKGVAAAKVRGGFTPEVRVDADEDRLAALGLTLDDLAAALRAENVNQPGGTLKDWGAVYLVRTLHEFDDLEQLRRTVVRETPHGRVRVEDVARVYRGHRDREVITRSQGVEVVELALHREGSSNTIAVAEAIRDETNRLRAELPDDLDLRLLTDQSIYIADAIGQVWTAALLGLALAVVVLYFFLRDLISTIIIGVTIPVSVLATFLFVSRAGVSLNIMSLGGLALGVGMLVDNSIVVLEAIDRRRREGLSRKEAAAKGASEVAGAVTAATLTTVCVFLPIVFVQGIAGQLFYDLAVTVCLSLMASLLVSLTLIPSMAAWDPAAAGNRAGHTLFRWDQRPSENVELPWTFRVGKLALGPVGNGRHWLSVVLTVALFLPRVAIAVTILIPGSAIWLVLKLFRVVTWPASRFFDGIASVYPGTLGTALRWRWIVLPFAGILLALSLLSVRGIGTQLVPDLAQGEFAFRLYLSEGTPLESTSEVVDRIEASLVGDGRFRSIFSLIGEFPSAASGKQERGEHLAQINFVLSGDTSSQDEAAAVGRVRHVLSLYPSVEGELVRPSVLTLKPPVGVNVFSDDLDLLERASDVVLAALVDLPVLRDVASSSEPGNPEIRVELDRERAGALGVQAEQVSRLLQSQIQGEVIGQFREDEERIDIRLRSAEGFRDRATQVAALRIRLPDGTAVPVSAVADVVVDRGPAAIDRIGGSRVVEVTAHTTAIDLGTALGEVRGAVSTLAMPPGTFSEIAGQDEELRVSFDSLRLALALALFMVYVVMAVQFESLIHPFVILFSVPMGLIGVVAALHITDQSISVLVLIGVVMLSGIVVNNAIVLVDAINRRRREGQGIDAAVVGAGRERLRPILMTTTTTVLALLPMAMGLGAGDELRAPLAVTVIGGLTGATILTLIVTPCIYRVLAGGFRNREPAAARAPSVAPVTGGGES